MFENEDRNATPAARKEVQGTTANPGAKFAIGMLAGIAAVLLPRLLAKSDDAHIVFFPSSYFLLAAGVGVFLGLVMLVLEYQVPTRPKETFMAALGAGHPQGRRLQPPGGGSAPAGQTRGRHLFAADPVRQQCVCARQQLRARGGPFRRARRAAALRGGAEEVGKRRAGRPGRAAAPGQHPRRTRRPVGQGLLRSPRQRARGRNLEVTKLA